MAIKWRCAKWPVLNSDDGEETISEHTEGSFMHKAHLNWKENLLHFKTFMSFAWGTPIGDVLQGYLLLRTLFWFLQDSFTERPEHRLPSWSS